MLQLQQYLQSTQTHNLNASLHQTEQISDCDDYNNTQFSHFSSTRSILSDLLKCYTTHVKSYTQSQQVESTRSINSFLTLENDITYIDNDNCQSDLNSCLSHIEELELTNYLNNEQFEKKQQFYQHAQYNINLKNCYNKFISKNNNKYYQKHYRNNNVIYVNHEWSPIVLK